MYTQMHFSYHDIGNATIDTAIANAAVVIVAY